MRTSTAIVPFAPFKLADPPVTTRRPFPSANTVLIAGSKPVLVDSGYGASGGPLEAPWPREWPTELPRKPRGDDPTKHHAAQEAERREEIDERAR